MIRTCMEQTGCRCVRRQSYGFLQPRAARSRHATLSVKAQAEPQHYDFFTRHVPLQGNEGNQAFWLLDPFQDNFFNVHGPDFIIQRPESFAQIFPKLRLRKLHERNFHIQTVPKPQPGACAMVKCDSNAHQVPVVFEGQQFVADVTLLLEQVVEQPAAAPYGIIPTVSPGLVHVPVELEQGEDGQEVFIGSSSSPRRTKMVGFTCLRCNARSYKPVNPLSFQEGTLVVQCGKCQCWHKIRDHLHLFHDMKGELFFRASPITHADVPEALRAPLNPFYWMEGLEGFNAENN